MSSRFQNVLLYAECLHPPKIPMLKPSFKYDDIWR